MYGDFSRWTHDIAKRYRRVLQQQGRVLTDADWNELNAVLADETRLLTWDIIGSYGGPSKNCGFFITLNPKDLPNDHPNKQAFLRLQNQDGTADLYFGAGHYWVNGLLCTLTESTTFRHQPNRHALPNVSDTAFLDNAQNKNFLLYLEVWERFLTENDDALLRDPALTETCARSQIVWQVRAEEIPNVQIALNTTGGPVDAETRRRSADAAETLLARKRRESPVLPKLLAKLGGVPADNDPCILPADARYRGRENQLYRVEIHKGGAGAEATWKWSRDNGSMTFPILHLEGRTAIVAYLGRDEFTTLNAGDWVEILDDALILNNQPGTMARVTDVRRDEFIVTLDDSTTGIPQYTEKSTTHPFLRRWDHKGVAKASGALPVADAIASKSAKLEAGIEIQFAASEKQLGGKAADEIAYRTGDYWLIPARTDTGNIEWPLGKFLEPAGIEWNYAPLAILHGTSILDIRSQFEPLAKLIS